MRRGGGFLKKTIFSMLNADYLNILSKVESVKNALYIS